MRNTRTTVAIGAAVLLVLGVLGVRTAGQAVAADIEYLRGVTVAAADGGGVQLTARYGNPSTTERTLTIVADVMSGTTQVAEWKSDFAFPADGGAIGEAKWDTTGVAAGTYTVAQSILDSTGKSLASNASAATFALDADGALTTDGATANGDSPTDSDTPEDTDTGNSANTSTDGTGRCTSSGPAPVDPNANATTKNLLACMYEYKGKYLITGQMDGDHGEDEQATLANRNGGVYPAIHGYDWAIGGVESGNATTYLDKIVSEWQQYKVIPTVSQHWTPTLSTEIPPGCNDNTKAGGSADDILDPSTTIGKNYAAWKENLGDDFQTLSKAGVPILFRPFHEAGNQCFWWNSSTSDYVKVWKDTFTYLMTTRGLDNIIWVWNANGPNVDKAYYPGDAYVDVVSGDNYTVTNGDFTNDYKGYEGYSANKIVAVPEVAGVPDLSNFDSYPVAYEMTWSGNVAGASSDDQLKTFFADERAINRSTISQYLAGSLK